MNSARTAIASSTVALLIAVGWPMSAFQHGRTDAARPILPDSVGSLHHPIRTTEPLVQKLMDEGLTLFYGFNRDASRRSFSVAAAGDANAAMPHVGLALALGPNLNMDSSAAEISSACAS